MTKPTNELFTALVELTRVFIEGRNYDTQNPYTRPEVKAALQAIAVSCGKPREAWLGVLKAKVD